MSLLKFIPGYFVLSDATASGIVFLISLSGSLSVQKCKRLLYTDFVSCNFMESISSNIFWSLGFSIYNVILSAKTDSFTSFQDLVLFFFLSSFPFPFPNCSG